MKQLRLLSLAGSALACVFVAYIGVEFAFSAESSSATVAVAWVIFAVGVIGFCCSAAAIGLAVFFERK